VTPAVLQVGVVYLAVVAVLAAAAAAGLRCGPAVRTGVVVAELLLLVQVALAAVAYARGHRPAEPATNVGYVVVSVVLLPLLAGRALAAEGAGRVSRADCVVVALACAVTIVVVLRLHATWA
jgi:hypothetical protein